MNISLYLLFVYEQKKWPVIFYIIHGYNEVLKKNVLCEQDYNTPTFT